MNPIQKLKIMKRVGFRRIRKMQKQADESIALENIRICDSVLKELKRALKKEKFDAKQKKFWKNSIKPICNKTDIYNDFLIVYNHVQLERLTKKDWDWINLILVEWFEDGLRKFQKDYVKGVK